MDLEKGAGLTLNRAQIPAELHQVVPYIEKWSFDSLDDQDVFVAEMQEHRPEEIELFNDAIDEVDALITKWGRSLPFHRKHVSEITEEDWRHPYWAFLNVLKLREITGFDENDPEICAARQREAEERRVKQFKEATREADNAFRQRDYASYVTILGPFEDLLNAVQQKKKKLAMRRASEK
jgi:hypothetical protein